MLYLYLAHWLCARVIYDPEPEHLIEFKVDSDNLKSPLEYKKLVLKKLKHTLKAAKMKVTDGVLMHFVPTENGRKYRFKMKTKALKEKIAELKSGDDSDDDDDTIILTEEQVKVPSFIKGNVGDFSYKEYYEDGDPFYGRLNNKAEPKVDPESSDDDEDSGAVKGAGLDFGINRLPH